MRNAFADHMINLGKNDTNIFLTGDLGFNALEGVRDSFGERFINCGVSEQNMIGVAAGLAKKGFINIHASILPSWRGAAPIQRSIMNLDNKTGISIMKINNKLDAGPICNTYEVDIKKQDNAETISEKLSMLASEKILEEIDSIVDGKANFIEQGNKKATYARKIEKAEGKINWNNRADEILGLINGLYPTPGAWFIYKGERHKILEADVGNARGEPGIVLSENLEIGCNEKSLKIVEIQREGKKIQKTGEFLLGSKIMKGSNLNDF